jgi:uncharacterized membrane protein
MPRWLFFSIITVLAWGVWAVISRLIGDALTAAQSQALSMIGMLPVLAALAVSKRLTATGNRRRGSVMGFMAGALACAGNITFYHVLNAGPKAATIVPLTALYPLVTIVLAVLVLRERLNIIQLCGIVLALAAIWLFNVASVEGIASGWLAFSLIPIALWGISGLLQKISTNEISGELSALWFFAAFVATGLATLVLQPVESAPAMKTWLFVAALGLFFSVGNYTVLAAFASGGKASVIAPLTGLYPVVSVPIAIAYLDERVSGREVAGIVLAVLAVVAMAFERPAARPPAG